MRYPTNPLLLAILLAMLLLVSDVASAEDHPRVFCSDCRDPIVHPSDFGNTAFNTARRTNNGYTFDQLDVIEVVGPAGRWAWVNLAFEMMTIDIGFDIPTFIIPTGNMIIEITDANGNMTSYPIDMDIPNPLAVGTGTGPGYNPDGGSDVSEPERNRTTGGSRGENSGYYEDSRDYGGGWENRYGSRSSPHCAADFSEPNNTTIVCWRH
jgi:hypothetical protein